MHAVFSLVEGQNVQQTENAIEAYRKANYDSIVANDAKKVSSLNLTSLQVMLCFADRMHPCTAGPCQAKSSDNCTS